MLAQGHRILRQALRAVLQAESDCQVVGEAGTGQEAVELIERLNPDVVLLDLTMSDPNGLEVVRHITTRWPQTRVILLLSIHADETYVLEALRTGAAGCVLTGCSVADLVQAVREVAAGRRYLSPPLTDYTVEPEGQRH
jgi:DNA-binding NarL/FixJ family response regulator